MSALEEWQIEHNGLVIGDETEFLIAQISGLADIPEVLTTDRNILSSHGIHPGRDYLGKRAVTLVLEIDARTPELHADLFGRLATAFRPGADEAPVRFKIPGIAGGHEALFYARSRKRSAPISLDWLYGLPMVTVELEASDPRLYSSLSSIFTGSLGGSSEGLKFPLLMPAQFGAIDTGDRIQCPNSGSFPVAPLVRINGAATNPRLTHIGSGRTFALNLSIPEGDFVEVDFEERTVLLGGTIHRFSSLAASSRWWSLDPGENEIRFTTDAGTESGHVSVSYRSAWV